MCTFATVKPLIIAIIICLSMPIAAQKTRNVNPEDRRVDMDSPTFVPMVRVGKVLEDGDSIKYVEMNNV